MIKQPVEDMIKFSLEKYADMVRKISFMYLRNRNDVDDVFQEVFLKFLQNKVPFENEQHEKAWLIRVTINKCKDHCKSFWRQNTDTIEGLEIAFEDKAESDLIRAVRGLPAKYKDVIYLYYYEGYKVPEMAKMLEQKENTIYSNLHRAKQLLKQELGDNANEYTF
ncbi:sigma-70 family RNA polymerase sigma factor [Bacillus sp. RG28]|uniref:Sigma-70 family RNA polymerase sigma factor n=1 Tax=Gottfriedia endophytica TaxID=2820819 RepID=A0A940NLI1_9BACI|nr:sigma-70 family RNA polymerase sigma factor [Gottfriedia endophytica]MBP0723705.1 sigma-70 family RNA polymerase sigma factor [Gottfriedia endophytica]